MRSADPARPSVSADGSPFPFTVRPATAADYPAAGVLTVRAYHAAGFVADDSDYAATLADATDRAATTELLVAVTDAGAVVGTATLIYGPGSPYAELAGEGDAELRMLAVDPDHQGGGVGQALVAECIARAARAGCRRFVLSSRPDMHTAHRLYERLGFRRASRLDWEPVPGFTLIAYERPLAPAS